MTTDIKNDWAEYQESLKTLILSEYHDIDRPIAEHCKCPQCDNWMKYKGFYEPLSGPTTDLLGYRRHSDYRFAFAVCENCQVAHSF